ncbi:superoxide dismutase family protein [Flavobacterium aciduliphilum]|uniref:Superoxide dismutase [Cu-Zn] n=1 Tax=Flavobacterium aciduliphilum TaxID=1101402 RepID=A0A328Y7P6_9FLAO|nr:superoxide dismutase family protein [Flavobacterium aciduliphilum]RAR70058.1 Cu-Zn family superoxide dismutase [Flavobacterium aciduliphilum]
MKKILLTSCIAVAIAIACKSGGTTPTNTISIALESKSGSTVTGNATFTEKNGIVTFEAKLSGLKPGVHGIHIHEKADCSSGDATSAGGHWNPTHVKHGKWTDAEHHKGDIGNFTADEQGNATITLKTDEWCIGCGDTNKDILGKGLIVHDKADDFVTQPTGNAGARVACSAIIK